MPSRQDNRLLLAGSAAVVLGYWLPSASLISPLARRAFRVRARLDDRAAVALTFDDGPHPRGTPAVLAALAEEAVPAVFFLAGEQVERYPELAREIVAAGHQVGVHCRRHRNAMRLLPGAVEADLTHAAGTIEDATGTTPRLYRPPLGILTAATLRTARRQRWEVVLWERDGRDWRADATPQSISSRLVRDLRGGEILLLHDADHYSAPGSWQATATALPSILERLTNLGLHASAITGLGKMG